MAQAPRSLATLLVAGVALSAYASGGPGSLPAGAAENAAAADRTGVVAATEGGRVTSAAIEAAVRADAAQAWGLSDSSALQVTVEAVTWADGALGCPRAGQLATQALVPGFRFVVRDRGREALYHASARGAWIRCPAGRATPPAAGVLQR